ncbi:hypothetical protein M409DRAFT_56098 [Zasmidium cellare ATCC 36951]|uniref:Ubiquitin 3 binding protein But2 C-terminal domain-containing protein n=1 Tax=Zasmidium cellare ATCC 36951 TaxID=1080233 RepID=A0A6A6CDG0_ZASCE|nr:uncharacterized protein M409DRAFT_56098 [Zasmidium cellare ATCC 36951]KAF2165224.1 hypothetical protein M409DRAFT_56098 [Zasmidium cellare ATCC 36951]
MHSTILAALATFGLTVAFPTNSASQIQVGYTETGPWTAEGGFDLPAVSPMGLWRHVVNETAGIVTSTFLGVPYELPTNDTSDVAIDIPAWPANAVATCGNQHFISDHITIAKQELGRWCDANGNSYKLGINTNYSFVYIDVAVGFSCSDNASQFYKAYGIVEPGGGVCNQGNLAQ